MSAVIDAIAERSLVIVMGKGGVGKSTIAAALGLDAARRGRRVCLFENSHTESLAPLFGREAVGDKGAEVAERLWVRNLDPRRAFEAFARPLLRSKTLTRLLFSNRLVETLIAAMPGIDELLLLRTMLESVGLEPEEARREGAAPFDLAIFDAPATGHGVTLLQTPRALMEMVRVGPIYALAERVEARLSDPAHSLAVAVTLGEEMPLIEASEMIARVKEMLPIPWAPVIVNMVHEAALEPAELAQVMAAWSDEPLARELGRALSVQVEQARVNASALERLAARIEEGVVALPRLARGELASGPGLEGLEEVLCHLKSSCLSKTC